MSKFKKGQKVLVSWNEKERTGTIQAIHYIQCQGFLGMGQLPPVFSILYNVEIDNGPTSLIIPCHENQLKEVRHEDTPLWRKLEGE